MINFLLDFSNLFARTREAFELCFICSFIPFWFEPQAVPQAS